LKISISGGSLNSNYNLRNVNVTQGFNSSNEEYLEINMDEYVGIADKEITIAKDNEGNVKVFCLADVLVQHGFIN
jgi:dihydroxyacetone kinase-like predicted kinase